MELSVKLLGKRITNTPVKRVTCSASAAFLLAVTALGSEPGCFQEEGESPFVAAMICTGAGYTKSMGQSAPCGFAAEGAFSWCHDTSTGFSTICGGGDWPTGIDCN